MVVIIMLVSLMPATALADSGDKTSHNHTNDLQHITVKIDAGAHGKIYSPGSQNIPWQGDTWSFTAMPDSGYRFSHWTYSGNEGSISTSGTNGEILNVNISQQGEWVKTGFLKGYFDYMNYKAQAVFEPVQQSVTLELGAGGTFAGGSSSVTLDGYPSDTLTVPSYNLNDGYSLVGWSSVLNFNTTKTVYAEYEYLVNFAGNTGITITGGTPVWTSGHAVPEPSYTVASGYRFDGWNRSLSGITAPTTITAKPGVVRGTLTVSSTSGGSLWTAGTINNKTYDAGTPIELNKATPKANIGWDFDGWIDDSTGTNIGKDPTITIQGDCSYTAKFIDIEWLDTSAAAHGYLADDLDGHYERGQVVDLNKAKPTGNTGYEPDCWKEFNGSWEVVPDPTHVVIGDQNIFRAYFKVAEYDIDTSVTGGTITADQTVRHGGSSTITYSANTGYHLVSVTVDGTDMTATNPSSYTFSNVTADHTINVVYAIDTFTIDTTVTNGTITADQTVNYGGSRTITYSADPGYHLVSVTVDGTDVTTGNENSFTFSNVTADHTINVVYAIDTFTIDTTVTNGTITADQTVNYGGSRTITYSADPGYHLVSVTVDGTDVTTGNENSFTFSNVTADHTINVVYAIDTFTIDTTVTNGTITADQTVNYGGSRTITYSADPGYHLVSVTVDGTDVTTGNENSFTFSNVTADHTINVVYAIDTFTIDTTVTGGTITADQTVNYGGSRTITYSADPGYHLVSVTVDGTDVTTGNENSFTFSNVTADHTINVVYAIDTFTINTTVTGGTITADQTVNYGGSSIITYSADTGYHLVSVTVDGTDVTTGNENSFTFSNVTADHTINVVYAIDTFTIDTTVTGGTITSDQTVNYGGSSIITYSADTGYHLVSVTVDGTDMTATNPSSYTFSNVTADHTINVVYAIDTFTIDTTVTGGTITSDQTVNYGGSSTITYDPASSGYHLVSVTVDGTDMTATNPSSYTFSNVTANHTIVVEYEYRFEVTANSSMVNGGIKVTYAGDVRYLDPGQSTTFTEVSGENLVWFQGDPDAGYQFKWWKDITHRIYVNDNGRRSCDIFSGTQFTPSAVFKPIVYTITYNMDGGTNDAANPATYTIEDADIVLADPTKAGYDFAGWTPGDTITSGSMGDQVFDAAWTPTVYTITYNMDGGTNNAANPATYTIEDADIVLANPTKAGYDFTGWSPNDTITSGSMGNQVFDAVWTPTVYTITYNMDDGTNNAANPATYTIEDADIVLADPTKAGYDFTGWTPGDTIAAGSMGDQVFDAAWTPTVYTITYNMDGGTNNAANPTTYTIEDADIVLGNPTKAGYDFAGWTPGDTIAAGSMGNKAFDAVWTPTIYTITYDLAGGSVATANPATYTIEDTDIVLVNPTRTGYTFTGWSGTDLVDGTDNVTIATGSMGDRSYTAAWAINTYTVTFVDYDGTELSTDVVAHGRDAVAPDDPTRDGYAFDGWDRGFGNVTSSFTVTATYTINTYTVQFVDYDGTLLDEQTVAWNEDATAPAEPERDGYTFTGWDIAFTSVTEDLTVTATYAEIVNVETEPVPLTQDTTGIDDEDVPAAGGSGFAWWWIPIIGAAALLLFLILFFWKRRKKDEEGTA